MPSRRWAVKIITGEKDWRKDRRFKHEPIIVKCAQCGIDMMPNQWDARRDILTGKIDRKYYCCPDCMYDAQMLAREHTHCQNPDCGNLLPDKRRPGRKYCCRACSSKMSHANRDKSSYRGPSKK